MMTRTDIINQLKKLKVITKDKTKKQIVDEYKIKLKPYLEEQKKLGKLTSEKITYKTIDAKGHIVVENRKVDEVQGVLNDIKSYLETLGVIK